MKPIIEARNLTKKFPGMLALDQVDFELLPGEVHAIAGENGAGKSTLMLALAGVHQPDNGDVLIDGEPVRLRDPHHSQTYGISTVFQEMALAPNMSVAENVFTNQQPTNQAGLIDFGKMYRDTEKALEPFGVHVDPTAPLKCYSVAIQQIVEIARAIQRRVRVLILDEPTSAIGKPETEKLLQIIRMLKDRGVSIIYVSHKLEEVFAIADRITVLKDGKLVGTVQTEDVDPDRIVEMMIGRELIDLVPPPVNVGAKETLMRISNLSGDGYSNVNLEINTGEILGIFGLTGAGRTELARGIFGIDPAKSGEIIFKGKPTRITEPCQAMDLGIAYIPEDRKQDGLFLEMSIKANTSAACLKSLSGLILMQTAKEVGAARAAMANLDVKATGIDQVVGGLSGGNQQKVLFAKWLARRPRLMIADEPTRGVDVGAKAEIHNLLRDLPRQGAAVVMISSELPEILSMSDRVAIMREGRLAAVLTREEASEERVAAYALGTRSDPIAQPQGCTI